MDGFTGACAVADSAHLAFLQVDFELVLGFVVCYGFKRANGLANGAFAAVRLVNLNGNCVGFAQIAFT